MGRVERLAIHLWVADGGKESRWPDLDEGQEWNTTTKAFWRKLARVALAFCDAEANRK